MIEITKVQKDYELLDSGEGEKLERYGEYVLRRPDPQALWKKNLPDSVWQNADASYSRDDRKGTWDFKKDIPKSWEIEFGGLNLKISPTAFKHTGLFPEQLPNWEWMEKILMNHESRIMNQDFQILNLFGYTGGASLICAKAGAKVTHVDASKSAINWGKENEKLSGLDGTSIRWILDDAVEFVRKEIKRGKSYDGIILDPPAFGHGPTGEIWKIEDDFVSLIDNCKKLLSPNPIFFIINGYASGYSAIAYENNLLDLQGKLGGKIEKGELAIEEKGGRLLPSGIFARWSN